MQLQVNLTLLKILSLLFLAAVIHGCSGKKLVSQWDHRKITIDGNDNDWETYPIEYNEDLDMVYGIANDKDALNVMLSFQDNRLARLINARGIVVWADGSGKKSRDLGIRYIDHNALDIGLERLGRMSRGSPEELSRFREQPAEISGNFYLLTADTTEIPPEGVKQVMAAATYQDYAYCYEFRIPLTESPATPYAVNAASGKSVKIGFEIAGVDEETRQQIEDMMRERRDAMRGQGGGFGAPGGGGGFGNRPPGGARGPGGSAAGSPEDMVASLDAREIWLNVQLAGN